MRTTSLNTREYIPAEIRDFLRRRSAEFSGIALVGAACCMSLALVSWNVGDPSLNHATGGRVHNLLGLPGAIFSDMVMQFLGLAAIAALTPVAFWGWQLVTRCGLERLRVRVALWLIGTVAAAGAMAFLPPTGSWPLPIGLGGALGDAILGAARKIAGGHKPILLLEGLLVASSALLALSAAAGVGLRSLYRSQLKYAFTRGNMSSDEKLPASKAYGSDEEDIDGKPNLGLAWAGAVLHGLIKVRSFVAARAAARRLAATEKAAAVRRPWLTPGSAGWEGAEGAGAMFVAAKAANRVEPSFGLNGRAPEAMADSAGRTLNPQTATAEPQARAAEAAVAGAPKAAVGAAETERRVQATASPPRPGKRAQIEARGSNAQPQQDYELPPLAILAEARKQLVSRISEDALEQNARLLEGVLDDFGVKGEIIQVRPGPVVTLYELEPAPGIKSSRVIGLADDIARSMSALSARVAVVQGRNAIGIELPNQRRETVYLRELLASESFEKSQARLGIALGKTIGGEAVIVDLARMPHLLVAGTTGSGKSVAINTMILSLLYRLKPEECRLIMVDPKMLELSVYDGIPHLLTPVVTDPKKAVVALKWAVREMEDRYKKMSRVGVRNIDGFNARVAEAAAKGEPIMRTVQTGFDKETGEAVYEQEQMDLATLPYIVVIVDEMADLMMVAGKDIEGAIQRLAQMARAAGIHLIMATQRPSVDVITGTIKANFPTRISFQVTSKIDSRTILGEQGAEQLLGQGDMLYMAGGGRISRVHGPFVSDTEVEKVVSHLKAQGQPQYLEAITADEPGGDAEDGDAPLAAPGSMDAEESGDLYDRAVNIVLRDRKCSTSYIQRRLSVGYNKAASLVEKMEKEGVVGAPNHSGKREILVGGGIDRGALDIDRDD